VVTTIYSGLGIPIWESAPKTGRGSATRQSSDARGCDVVGQFANLLIAAWWIDAVTSLGIVSLVLKEAHEAWSGEDCCAHA
jgi:hypothetical protein